MNHILALETKEETTLCTALKAPEQEMNSSVSHHSGLNVRQKRNAAKAVVPTSRYSPAETSQLNGINFVKVSLIFQVFVPKDIEIR